MNGRCGGMHQVCLPLSPCTSILAHASPPMSSVVRPFLKESHPQSGRAWEVAISVKQMAKRSRAIILTGGTMVVSMKWGVGIREHRLPERRAGGGEWGASSPCL